jgi:hypothetical protein
MVFVIRSIGCHFLLQWIAQSWPSARSCGATAALCAQARSTVSCTRSSARSTLPVREMANARRRGTAARIILRLEPSVIRCGPLLRQGGVEVR